MKHFYSTLILSFGLTLTATAAPLQAAEPHHVKAKTVHEGGINVIDEQPQGELVYYSRTGGMGWAYNDSDGSLALQQMQGVIALVYGEQGKVYMKTPVYDCDYYRTWIEGTVSGGGTTLTFPTGQYIAYDDNLGFGLQIFAGTYDEAEETYIADKSVTSFSYTVDPTAGTMQLNGYNSPLRVLGTFYTDDESWGEAGEYNSTFKVTEAPTDRTVLPPADISTQIWTATCRGYDEDGQIVDYDPYIVEMGTVGTDVYIRGIYSDMPAAWIKGTTDGEEMTFKGGQYMGELEGYETYFFGYSSGLGDAVFTLNAQGTKATAKTSVVINADPHMLYYWEYFTQMTLEKGNNVGIININVNDNDNPYFDLTGLRTTAPQRGFYIHKGNKILK